MPIGEADGAQGLVEAESFAGVGVAILRDMDGAVIGEGDEAAVEGGVETCRKNKPRSG